MWKSVTSMALRLLPLGFMLSVGGQTLAQSVSWSPSTTYLTTNHTIVFAEHANGGTTTIDITYDGQPLGSLAFKRDPNSGNLVYQDDPAHSYIVYTDCDCIVNHTSWTGVAPDIAPLYLGFSTNKTKLPPTATLYVSPSAIYIGILTGTPAPPPCGGWGNTNPCNGEGNPGWPGDDPNNPFAPNGGPGGNATGNCGHGGRGGNATGNGNGGAGGNGSGEGSGGAGGNGAGNGCGGAGGNGDGHGGGGQGGNGAGSGTGGQGGNGGDQGDGGRGGSGGNAGGSGASGGNGGYSQGHGGTGGSG